MSAQRKVVEERQRIEAEQQQAKQQAIWEADEKRRKAAAEAAETSRAKEEMDRKSQLGRIEAERRKLGKGSSGGQFSSPFGTASATPAPSGQSLGQAMRSSRPPRDDRSSERSSRDRDTRRQERAQNHSSKSSIMIRPAQNREESGGSETGFRLTKLPARDREDPRHGQSAQTSSQNASRQPRDAQAKQPKRVAMPDFMLPQKSAGATATPTTGWGARATDVKPLEYGDVPSNVKDIDELPSNVQDVRDLQNDGAESTRDGQAFSERQSGQHERRLNFSHRSQAPASSESDQGIEQEGSRSPSEQEVVPSHPSTLDTFGHYEDEATPEFQAQQDEPSAEQLSDISSPKSHGIAEAAVRAASFGRLGQAAVEEQSRDSPAGPHSLPTSQASVAPQKPAAARLEEPSSDTKETTPAIPASPTPAAAPVDVKPEQGLEPQRSPDTSTRAAIASSTPPPPSSPEMSPEQREMMEKIEQMRRMVEEFDRMKAGKSADPLPTPATPLSTPAQPSPPAQPKTEQYHSDSFNTPPTASASAPSASESFKRPPAQHRLGDTGYRATPFNPDELFQTSKSSVEDDGKWGHLRRQQDNKSTPPPPQAQTSQPRSQSQQQIPRIREEDADKLFEAHRATRTSYAPPASSEHESYVFTRQTLDLSNKKCARCGQMGHTATMCRGPRLVCHNCGKEGHYNRDCPEPRKRPAVMFKVFVGGVSQDTTPADFQRHFTGHEGVVSIRLMTHVSEGPGLPPRSRGFGFIGFGTEQARERFLETGPHTLHGKSLTIQRDQGSSRDRADQSHSNAPNERNDRTPIANPFKPAGPADDGHDVVRGPAHYNFTPNTFSDPVPPQEIEEASSSHDYEDHDPSERRRGFKQTQPSSTSIEEPKRGARDARRRQWEEPEEEVEKSDKVSERKGRRGSRREIEEDEEDERGGAREAHRARKAARQRQKDAEKDAEKQAAKRKRELKKKEAGTPITLPEFISVQHLSQALGVRYEAFVERLEELGYDDVFAGKTLDSETSGMIAMEYNFDPTFDGGYREEEVRDLKARPPLLDKESLPVRPPVVTIMGHVDHGKTTLLDYLRKSSVAAGEAGGITQHIGAFSVPLAASGRTVTFLDTPGHAAFLAMRQRGANVTDMVILVVAADDSVKPQTLEAIKHAKEAGVPMIVALNKIDKPEADVERCKQDLARHGVEIEDYGGEVQVVEVSGKTGKGLDALEENIVALSELLDHRAETDGVVEGWVLEATTRKAGRVATVLVRRGTLVPGAVIVAGKAWARVRTLKNEAGVEIEKGGPGMPCEVDGWRDQPSAGDEVLEAPTEQKAGSVVEYRIEVAEREQTKKDMEVINTNRKLEQEKREKEKAAEQAAKRAAAATTAVGPDGTPIPVPAAETAPTSAVEPEAEKESGQLTIPFIIKADVSGSAEAVAAYILSLSSPLIAPTILGSGVGSVHESDIELASAAEGHIIAFNLPNDPEAMGKATARGVKILANDIIYRCLDDVKAVLEDKLPPIITSRVTGEAEISAVFEIGVGGRKKISIAGVKVRNGSVARNSRVRVMRGGEKVYDGEFFVEDLSDVNQC